MNEKQWLSGTDPEAMLEHLRGRVTERKLRLFACACVRRHWNALTDPRSRQAVVVGEAFADGLACEVERFDAWDEAMDASSSLAAVAAVSAVEAEEEYANGDQVKVDLLVELVKALSARSGTRQVERAAQCALLRCLFGPRPFGTPPRVGDALRLWCDRTVSGLARTIYDEHAFDLLPVLADALEEAGCMDAIIIEHLRDGGPHARGCFALDSCLLP